MTEFSPETDLELSRDLAVSPLLVWRCWSDPALLKQWFTPPPVEVTECLLDLRPGGAFTTTMKMPGGDTVTSRGCFLEVVPERSLVFTDALLPGFRPGDDPFMTVRITLVPSELGTLYHAHVLHPTAQAREEHESMGFAEGWGTALDQLEELAQSLDAPPLF